MGEQDQTPSNPYPEPSVELPDHPDVIALPPVIYGAALGLGTVIHFMVPMQFLPERPAVWLGILLIVTSIPIVMSALGALARARTSFDVRKPTTAIVTDGAFRFSRNPMYLAATLLYLGIALVMNSVWVLVLIVPLMVVMQRGVVEREERYLERKFGEEYRRHKTQVRRWM